ncbi:MAG TPA: hypothetical protein VML54_13060 [Candidatus Limnocylindrales bacterium]|nr:hypothetical protein [Candidatus Limnocylindrales bacterium]
MNRRGRLALVAVAASAIGASLLISVCASGGNMGARHQTCECLGIEWEIQDGRASDGPHRTVCLGLIRSRTCHQMTGGPVIDCDGP